MWLYGSHNGFKALILNEYFYPTFSLKNIILCRIGLKIQILEAVNFKASKKFLPKAPRSQSVEVCIEICTIFLGNKAKSEGTGGNNGLCDIQAPGVER